MKSKALLTLLLGALPTLGNAQVLEQAVLKSIEENPEVGVVLDQYRARQEAIGIARSGYLPTIDLEAGYGWEDSDNPGLRAQDTHDHSLNRQELALNLRQMLFDGFRTKNDLARASAESEAHRYALQSAAEDIALRTTEVYLAVLRAERELQLATENLESHRRIYGQIKQRTDQGIGSSSDLDQVEGRLARAESNRIAAENNLADARNNFVRVVGEMPTELRFPSTAGLNLPATLADAEAEAQAQHPTLISARLDLDAAGKQIKVLESAHYPKLTFELGSTWNDNLDGADGHNNDMTAMFRVRYNLFSGWRDTREVGRAARQRDEARDIVARASRQLKEGLALSWNAREFLGRQIEYLERHVVTSGNTLEAYTKQFELGRRTLMDLLDMENEQFEAKKSLLQAEVDLALASYRVLNATGSLLANLSVEAPAAWGATETQTP